MGRVGGHVMVLGRRIIVHDKESVSVGRFGRVGELWYTFRRKENRPRIQYRSRRSAMDADWYRGEYGVYSGIFQRRI